jgi:hypothetical protein
MQTADLTAGVFVFYLKALYTVPTISKASKGKVTVDNELKRLEVDLPRKNTKCIRTFSVLSTFEPSASWLGILETLAAFRKTRYEYYATG